MKRESTRLSTLFARQRLPFLRNALFIATFIFFPVVAVSQVEPLDSGLVEQVETGRILLDIEVQGPDGSPLRGLTLEDFEVFVDDDPWPLLSVDDLCACENRTPGDLLASSPSGPPGEAASSPISESSEAAGSGTSEPLEVPLERERFILYFDFSLLQAPGIKRAIEESKRWVSESRPKDSDTMIVAYVPEEGLLRLADFTSDGTALTHTLERMETDERLHDGFAGLRRMRTEKCERCLKLPCLPYRSGAENPRFCCTNECFLTAADESSRMLLAGRALNAFLTELQALNGPKSLILFHQNGTLSPHSLFGVSGRQLPDQFRPLEDTGAAATDARTTIHVAYAGDRFEFGRELAVNYGANLADFTGGTYNRGPGDLGELLRGARRGCCRYLLALAAPQKPDGKTHQVRVRVRGRRLPRLYRLTFPTEEERWRRSIYRVLFRPDSPSGVRVATSLLPLEREKKRWRVAVEVSFRLGDLEAEVVPSGAETRWSAGSLVLRDQGEEFEDFEADARLVVDRDDPGETWVLHSETLELAPGEHELSSYVGDLVSREVGGARDRVTLPALESPSTLGPTLRRVARHVALPFADLERRSAGGAPPPELETGPLPFLDATLSPGETLRADTLFCSGSSGASPEEIRRAILSRWGEISDQAVEPKSDEDCERLSEEIRLDPETFPPGDYLYEVTWRDPNGEKRSASTPFAIAARSDPGEASP